MEYMLFRTWLCCRLIAVAAFAVQKANLMLEHIEAEVHLMYF